MLAEVEDSLAELIAGVEEFTLVCSFKFDKLTHIDYELLIVLDIDMAEQGES